MDSPLGVVGGVGVVVVVVDVEVGVVVDVVGPGDVEVVDLVVVCRTGVLRVIGDGHPACTANASLKFTVSIIMWL